MLTNLTNEEITKLVALESVLSKNEIDSSLYSAVGRENNRICLFEDSGVWFSAFLFENKEHNLKKYLNFEYACIDFISILSKVSGKNKEQEKNILSDLREKLIELKYPTPTLRPWSK